MALTDGVGPPWRACVRAIHPQLRTIHKSLHRAVRRSTDTIRQPGSDPPSLRSEGSSLLGEASGQGGWGAGGAGPQNRDPALPFGSL